MNPMVCHKLRKETAISLKVARKLKREALNKNDFWKIGFFSGQILAFQFIAKQLKKED